MYHCPSCRVRLERVAGPHGRFWHCSGCDGRAATIAVLRRSLAREQANRIWQAAHEESATRGHPCPFCTRAMRAASIRIERFDLQLDVCRLCQIVWFDPREYGELPAVPAPKPPKELAPEARLVLAQAELQRIQEREKATVWDGDPPEEHWKLVPAILGMPVEVDDAGIQRWPAVTWTLGAAMVVATVLVTWHGYERFGFVPSEALRLGGLTILTSFFLHADVVHLLGNLYFLIIFGDDVEDWWGHSRYLLLVVAATAAGHLAHAAWAPDSTIPVVGASGGISGVIACYVVRFPHAKIGLLFVSFLPVPMLRWITAPAYALFAVWVLYQLLLVQLQVAGLSSVSALAHVGGAVVGFSCAWLCRD